MDGVFLHSRYDPLREAHRHLESLDLTSRTPRTVVVIGEGIPYLSEAISARYPDVAVFAVLLGPISHDHRVVQIDLTSLEDGDLRRWVRRTLSPLDAGALELVTWEPGRRVAPKLIAAAQQETLEVVRNASAEIATIGSFGRRWLANAIRSAILVDHRRQLPRSGTTATLATSGPSLERLRTGGRTAFPGMLAVTSSAWSTLTACDIVPEMVVHTDGGYWATRYLRPFSSYGGTRRPVVAMPAHAAVPDALVRSPDIQPFSFLSTGWLGEQLHTDVDEWYPVPEAPTVTATALHVLHHLLPHGKIYLAGLDLMSRGLLDHARPHPNDRLIATGAHRLRPELAIRAERILRSPVTLHAWTDSVVGYQSPAMEAFLPEIDRIVALHRTSGSVAWLGADDVTPTAHSRPQSVQDEERWYGRPSPSVAPPSNPALREHSRPPRTQRIAHARRVLRLWRTAAVDGTWDTEQREILFHLAPVEVLKALRGELDTRAVATSAKAGLDLLEQVVEKISSG